MANKYCDSCLTVAYDAVFRRYISSGLKPSDAYAIRDKPDIQEQFLDKASGMALLEDHQCDRIETDGEIPCKCRDHR